MKTTLEWEQQVINITTTIHQEYPELSKYIIEMPINNSAKYEVNCKNLADYFRYLQDVVQKYTIAQFSKAATADGKKPNSFPTDFSYPPSDDIYSRSKEESEINPEDTSKTKTPNDGEESMNEKGFENHLSGRDLDVPGAELDDEQEDNGNEDEENNSYSLGGDRHNDLEENQGQ